MVGYWGDIVSKGLDDCARCGVTQLTSTVLLISILKKICKYNVMFKRLEHLTAIQKAIYLISLTIFINFTFAFYLFLFVDKTDFKHLPNDPLDKFLTLFYFSLTTYTTIGYGDFIPLSMRARLATSVFMIFVYSITILFITHYF